MFSSKLLEYLNGLNCTVMANVYSRWCPQRVVAGAEGCGGSSCTGYSLGAPWRGLGWCDDPLHCPRWTRASPVVQGRSPAPRRLACRLLASQNHP
jgi:hypothetical protein